MPILTPPVTSKLVILTKYIKFDTINAKRIEKFYIKYRLDNSLVYSKMSLLGLVMLSYLKKG